MTTPGLILDNLSIFSEKQRRFLRSEEWAPNKAAPLEEEDKAEAEEEREDRNDRNDRKDKADKDKKRDRDLRDRDSQRSPSVKRDRERLTERAVEKVDGRRESREATDGKATVKANAKRSEDNKSGDAEKDAGGGWTFTIRERPMPDPLTSGKKRRKGAEDPEASKIALSFCCDLSPDFFFGRVFLCQLLLHFGQ